MTKNRRKGWGGPSSQLQFVRNLMNEQPLSRGLRRPSRSLKKQLVERRASKLHDVEGSGPTSGGEGEVGGGGEERGRVRRSEVRSVVVVVVVVVVVSVR